MFNVNERITYYKSLLADYSEEQLQELKRLGQKEHLQELYKEFIGHRMDVEKRLKQILTDKRIPGKATVGADYVGRLFNCSPEAVVRGRFGTGAIPRCRLKPVGFKKRMLNVFFGRG